MKLDIAIDKLNAFKKIAKKVTSNDLGECELIGLDDNSFTVKVTFKDDKPTKHIAGFSQS